MTKLHFVEGDTDSAYWAISGKQVKRVYQDGQCVNQQEYEDNLHQGFIYVIKDQQFYDTNAKYFFSTIKGDKFNEKKLLGLAFENEDDEMYALDSKNYYIHTFKRNSLVDVIKLKGYSLIPKSYDSQLAKALQLPQAPYRGSMVVMKLLPVGSYILIRPIHRQAIDKSGSSIQQ
ncbi:MAG: hypothetical protein EZS28_004214 [Streblomastix strix]|uniref:Uncharacterized protein n=1 Tax=Streblomastix strix TaxID=222440 RepID=A0A5J4X0W8_9EUKA|nr:MAG: hypothetical protein EZS28_004214 [Streblomastix strix]